MSQTEPHRQAMQQNFDARGCIIGAGPSGITAGKNLLQAGVRNFVIYEKSDQVGGNWVFTPTTSHSSVYETTHIISSKSMSQFDDFPMPADYPDYPSHRQMLVYFQDYVQHFGVMPFVRFNREVVKADEQADQTWQITLSDGAIERFDYLVVANGHHWDPRWPDYPGQFTGHYLHSHAYKCAEPFRGQRVLIIGGGNSACDIAVETSRISTFTAISMRRGYCIIPKFMMGQPVDVVNAKFLWLPAWLRLPLLRLSLYFSVGDYASYGLERPKHGLMQQHLTANSELLYFIRHGKVHPRRDVDHFDGRQVHFVDGRVEEYDTVIVSTGFKISFPFFDRHFIDFSEGDVPLYLHVFHPDHPSLFFIGLVQPAGSIWPLADAHARLAANAIIGNYHLPADVRQRIQKYLDHMHRDYLHSPRHTLEADYHQHLRALQKEIPKNAPVWMG